MDLSPSGSAKATQHSTTTTEGFHAPNIAHSAFTLTTEVSNLKQLEVEGGSVQLFLQVDSVEVNGIETESRREEILLVVEPDGRVHRVFSKIAAWVDSEAPSESLVLERLHWSPAGVLEGISRTERYCRQPARPDTCETYRERRSPEEGRR